MNVAIIGAGLIGRKRAAAVNKRDKLSTIGDIDLKSARRKWVISQIAVARHVYFLAVLVLTTFGAILAHNFSCFALWADRPS